MEYDACGTSHVELREDGTYGYCTLYHDRPFREYIACAEAGRASAVDPRSQQGASLLQAYPYAVALGLEKAWGARFAGFASGAAMEGGRWSSLAWNRQMRRAGQML